MQYQILYRIGPAWEVGANTPQIIPGSHYPGDYAGKVISVKPVDHTFTPADLAGDRALVELDLTEAKVADLRSRQLKITAGLPSPVTFDDRWGQLAVGLRARWGDDAEVEEALAVSRTAADLDSGTGPADDEFDQEVGRLKAALPSMVVHSGAGLYEVGPAKTYSTIQAALDQLWTDQGAATFTASQYIRVFAGTYDETVTPNAALVPNRVDGYLLVIEGDPADDRDNIKIDPASGNGVVANCDQMRVRHLWIDTVGATTCVYTDALCFDVDIFDCKLTSATTGQVVLCTMGARVWDCEITLTGNGRAIYSANSGFNVQRCKITGPGKATSTKEGIRGAAYYASSFLLIESTIIIGFTYGIYVYYSRATGLIVRNTDIYSCTIGVCTHTAGAAPMEVFNCIFTGCNYPYRVSSGAWPEESTTQTGPQFIQRNNCYHSYTNFAYDGSGTKTYAEWIAYGQVDSSGELDATDPLLTDPGAGDFSLQANSPCRHAGQGSGVPYDLDGAEFDPYHPDIGAKSTGIGPNVAFAGK